MNETANNYPKADIIRVLAGNVAGISAILVALLPTALPLDEKPPPRCCREGSEPMMVIYLRQVWRTEHCIAMGSDA